MPLYDDIKFSLREISDAVGIKPAFRGGVSYGAVELDIPLSDGRILRLREGDDEENDHSAECLNSPGSKPLNPEP